MRSSPLQVCLRRRHSRLQFLSIAVTWMFRHLQPCIDWFFFIMALFAEPGTPAVIVEDYTCVWAADAEKPTISNINLTVSRVQIRLDCLLLLMLRLFDLICLLCLCVTCSSMQESYSL